MEMVGPALTIHKPVDEVHVSFIVEDKPRRPVRNVVAAEIGLLEDGQKIRNLTSFVESSDLPLRLALSVDGSDSMRRNFREERRAAQQLAQRLLRSDVGSLFLVDFAGQSSLADVSGGPAELIEAKMKALEAAGACSSVRRYLRSVVCVSQRP